MLYVDIPNVKGLCQKEIMQPRSYKSEQTWCLQAISQIEAKLIRIRKEVDDSKSWAYQQVHWNHTTKMALSEGFEIIPPKT